MTNSSTALLLNQRLSEAKQIYSEIIQNEKLMLGVRDFILQRSWKLGLILSELKEQIGHGKWLIWITGHWPELGERNAQRCMAFYRANEGWKPQKAMEFLGFEVESVRKFMWGYIPAKDRLQLDGDREIKPGAHHLTFVNQFSKYDRQLKSGHINGFELETFQRELEPMLRRIIEIAGRDWVASLLS